MGSTMNSGISALDHLLCAVEHAQTAGDDFEKLGFTVTPISRIERAGVENRLVAFRPAATGVANYIELMGVIDRSRLPDALSWLLVGPASARCLMFGSDDAARTREALVERGLAPEPMHSYQRDWTLASGEVLQVAFDVVEPMRAPFAFGVCRHRTLHHYTRPEFTQHPNGAERILAVYLVSDQPKEDGAFYEELLGEPLDHVGDGASLGRREVALHFMTASTYSKRFPGAAVRPGIAGYQVGCRSQSETARYLAHAGIQASPAETGFYVGSAATHGQLVHFTEMAP